MRKAKALCPGSRVTLFAPSGAVRAQRVSQTRALLSGAGYDVRVQVPGERLRYLAGPDVRRAALFRAAWKNRGSHLLLATRGGFGAARMLDHVKAADFRRGEPRLVAGFSDVTALLNWLADRAGLITFHSPNGGSLLDANAATHRSFVEMLSGQVGRGDVLASGLKAARAGSAEGRLAGGNLIVLASLVGTPHQINIAGKILFLEDIHEEPYTIDRALTQLVQGGGLGKVRGVVMGSFHDRKNKLLPGKKIAEIALEHLPRRVPLLYGLRVGHMGTNLTLPIGAKVEISSRTGKLTLLENVVRQEK